MLAQLRPRALITLVRQGAKHGVDVRGAAVGGSVMARRTAHARGGASLGNVAACHRFAEGTSRYEIAPAFFQPSRKSHVLGWYTTSGS